MKRIIICADGTWNRPEKNLKKDFPTNVLKLARAIKPIGADGIPQQVFYDWGVGSYYDPIHGGVTGAGLHKNILDDYRYIVQNYSPGDEIFLFGFSRGAYTIRCLCGLINNCGIIKRPDAKLIQQAFNLYKKSGRKNKPSGENSMAFRAEHSHPNREVKFVGVWDTVGAMGIPISFLGLFKSSDEFYDTKLGKNVAFARHAMAIDEQRSDFEPTIWKERENMDIQQVWFCGVHSDVGGGYKPESDNSSAADFALKWIIDEATEVGLTCEEHLLANIIYKPQISLHKSRSKFFKLKKKFYRQINHQEGAVILDPSVKSRWDNDPKYRPKNLQDYIDEFGWPEE